MRSAAASASTSSSSDLFRERSRRSPTVYVFTINILKVTRIPSPLCLSSPGTSTGREKRSLKITVLHGSKQKEIGDFEIVQDVCLIDQRISCRLFSTQEDDLGKLHIYIGNNLLDSSLWDCTNLSLLPTLRAEQAQSHGLAGHIALDLKQFLDNMDTEVYIKYPLSASIPREGYVPKLKMTLECTCLGNPDNLFIPDMESIIHHHKQRIPMEVEKAEDTAHKETQHKEAGTSGERCPEVQLLKELENILLKLDGKLKNFIGSCEAEDEKDVPVDSSTVVKKPVVEEVPATGNQNCSDCAVCSRALLEQKKYQSISCPEEDEACDVGRKQQCKEPRPSMFKYIVGGALLLGYSVFAVRTMKQRQRRSSV